MKKSIPKVRERESEASILGNDWEREFPLTPASVSYLAPAKTTWNIYSITIKSFRTFGTIYSSIKYIQFAFIYLQNYSILLLSLHNDCKQRIFFVFWDFNSEACEIFQLMMIMEVLEGLLT